MNALAALIPAQTLTQTQLYAAMDQIAAMISPGQIAYAVGPGNCIRHRSGRLINTDQAVETLAFHEATTECGDINQQLRSAARHIAGHLETAMLIGAPQ